MPAQNNLIALMEQQAENAPVLELTPKNWAAEFGEEGLIATPMGEVKMGEHQYLKLLQGKRDAYFAMIKPTLSNPDIIIEQASQAKKGDTERASTYLFVKTFNVKGKNVKFFTSVTVSRGGLEVVVSNHEKRPSQIQQALNNGKLRYLATRLNAFRRNIPCAVPRNEQMSAFPTANIVHNLEYSKSSQSLTFKNSKTMKKEETSMPQEEQNPTSKKKKKQEPAKSVAEAMLGVNIDERQSFLSNCYSNFMQNYKREPWVKRENFKKVLPDLEKLGQTPEKLADAGVLDHLIDGRISGKTVPIVIQVDGKDVETTGKIVVHQNANGETKLKMYPVKQEANLKEYFGHQFTDEQVANIQKTGTPGEVIFAEFRQGEGKVPVLLKLDKDTNHFAVVRQNFVKIPEVFFGVHLSEEQKEQLKNGKVVKIEDMVSSKTGKKFHTNVQYSPEKKGLELLFEENIKQNQSMPKKLGGVELTEEQRSDMLKGKSVRIENMTDKAGKKYSAYVSWNSEKGKLDFSSKNPNDPTVQKIPTPEHQIQVAANNEGHKPEAIKNVKGAVEQKQPNAPTNKQASKQKQEKIEKVAPAKRGLKM